MARRTSHLPKSVVQSAPDPNSKSKPRRARWLSGLTTESSGLPEGAGVREANVRSELARKLVTQAYSAIELREPAANAACRVCLAVEFWDRTARLKEVEVAEKVPQTRGVSGIGTRYYRDFAGAPG